MSNSHSNFIGREDYVSDMSTWVMSHALKNGIPFDSSWGSIEIISPVPALEFITTAIARTKKAELVSLHHSLDRNAIMVHVRRKGDTERVSMRLVPQSLTEGKVSVMVREVTRSGDGELWENLLGAMTAQGVEAPVREGHYTITVHEFYSKKDGNGVLRIEKEDHRIDTGSKMLDLIPGMYPYLNMDKFISAFLSSKENLFLLYGDPGVGKTCMMKLLLRQTALAMKSGFHAIYVKDRKVLQDPEFWVQLTKLTKNTARVTLGNILFGEDADEEAPQHAPAARHRDSALYLILDDLDEELRQREKGADNFIVSQLLSFSDGLFETYLKTIITSNMDVSDIDRALIRPGRCFDILNLRQLTRDQALRIWTEGFNHTEEEFVGSFGDATNISQASLASEHNRIVDSRNSRDYLLDPSISIRRKLMTGNA